jgi:hypothetical protein
MIAFTNHALDHILCSVLDAKITSNIVRLGSRSADERISQYSIENMELVAGQSRLDRTFAKKNWDLRSIQDQLKKLMNRFLRITVDSAEIVQFLEFQYPEHFEHIIQPPRWISLLQELPSHGGDWQRVGKGGRTVDSEDNSVYAYWRRGADVEFLQQCEALQSSPPEGLTVEQDASHLNKFAILGTTTDDDSSDLESDEDSDIDEYFDPEEQWQKVWKSTPVQAVQLDIPEEPDAIVQQLKPPTPTPGSVFEPSDLRDPIGFFTAYGDGEIPPVPYSDRPLDVLLESGNMWSFSFAERERLHLYWTQAVRNNSHHSQLEVIYLCLLTRTCWLTKCFKDFEDLRRKHEEALKVYNEGKNEVC